MIAVGEMDKIKFKKKSPTPRPAIFLLVVRDLYLFLYAFPSTVPSTELFRFSPSYTKRFLYHILYLIAIVICAPPPLWRHPHWGHHLMDYYYGYLGHLGLRPGVDVVSSRIVIEGVSSRDTHPHGYYLYRLYRGGLYYSQLSQNCALPSLLFLGNVRPDCC